MLDARDQVAITGQVAALILAAGTQAQHQRADDTERLYGSDPTTLTELGTIPIELNHKPRTDLGQKIDAVASVLSECPVEVKDRLVIDGQVYRIHSIGDERIFGVVSHRVLELVAL